MSRARGKEGRSGSAGLLEGDSLDDLLSADAVTVAKGLIGRTLSAGGAGGVIVETEAYDESEAACHAHVGVTDRTSVLFGPPGTAYVYLSYGIHHLFNVVCDDEGRGAAVLIRAIEPTHGIELMWERRPKARRERDLCSGPGKLTRALAIGPEHNRIPLVADGPIEIGPAPRIDPQLNASPRIGITKAADLPWRFCLAGSPWLSAPG